MKPKCDFANELFGSLSNFEDRKLYLFSTDV